MLACLFVLNRRLQESVIPLSAKMMQSFLFFTYSMLNSFIFIVFWLRVLRNIISAVWILLALVKCFDITIIIIIIINCYCYHNHHHLLMQDIHTYIPETNYTPTEYSVAAILLLLFMVLISLVSVLNLLYFYVSTFRSMCTVPNMAVLWSSLTSCFPGMLLTYFLNDFEIVPVAPIIIGITFVFTFHMRCIFLLPWIMDCAGINRNE